MAAVTHHTIGAAIGLGLALGPFAWAVSQQASYVLATTRCGPGQTGLILGVNAAAAVLVLIGLGLCWRGWRSPAAGRETGSARGERRFAALLGLLSNLLFAGVILAQALAALFIAGCRA